MGTIKEIAKRLIGLTPYRVSRSPAPNRFQSIPEGLKLLAGLGFRPTHTVDAGANVGTFAVVAKRAFPATHVLMFEPQPACEGALRGLCKGQGFSYYPYAVAPPELSGQKIGFIVASHGVTTGARVEFRGYGHDEAIVMVEARSLDSVVVPMLSERDCVFLKLDLEGYDLQALKGASVLLKSTEAVLVESAFFADSHGGNSPLQLASYLAEYQFSLFDIFSVSGRPSDNRARQCDLLFVKNHAAFAASKHWN